MRAKAPRLLVSLVPQVLAVLLSACSGGSDTVVNPPPPDPADTTAPSVPAGITATAQSGTEILISWTASTDAGTGVAGYRIYRDGAAAPVASVTTTSYTDGNLFPGTNYSYTVRAFDAATPPNESALSGAVSASTVDVPVVDVTPPSVPANLTATPISPTDIRLTWTVSTDAGTGVGGYHVFRDGGATPIATVAGNLYVNTGLTANTSYTYTVRAFDLATPTANESGASTAASTTTLANPDITPPTVPGGVTATALSASQIRIDWTASTDAGTGVAGYRLFRNGSASVLATVTSGTTYTDSGLSASTLYSYALRAFDGATPANVSALSTSASDTTQAGTGQTSGLDTRPGNTTCLAGAAPSQSASFTFQHVYTALSFADPVAIMQAPNDNSRWYIVQQGGIVKSFSNVTNPTTSTNFIDVSGRITFSGGGDERGLLGMAFHPNYPTDPRVYLYYTASASGQAVDRVSEFRTTDGGATLNASTEVPLFNINDPESNHNGGNIVFGPDGYLYIGIGDGGGGNDQHGTIGNSQRLTILLGKMLRINVGSTPGAAYSIPSDNPFAGGARCNVTGASTTTNCPEIYAYGFRNPWRWSFDHSTGDLWVGDVGEGAWEEIDNVTLGGNYGWRCREGNHNTGMSCGPNPGPINPVAEIGHPDAAAITGGYVYRGAAIPGLNGRYIFGDYSSGYLWNIARDATPTVSLTTANGLGTPAQIASFGEDQARELYFLDFSNGWVYKIVPGAGGGGTIPTLLSQTGCANTTNPKLPASGMIPYAPNAAFWSDGAIKSRWLALPDGQRITIDGTTNHFDFPIGSVLRKDFTLGTTIAETRLFMRHTDGNWAGYTYQWNPQGTEATRVSGGLTTTINGQTWEFPSESACLICHTSAAGRSLGLETGQLNGPLLYPVTGRTANQVFTLNFIDTLTPAVTLPVEQLPVIPNPFGTSGTETERARAWLHTNCANCHRPSGGTPVNLDFRYTTTLLGTNSCDVQPTTGDLGIANARLIAVGDASRSVVLARVNRVGANQMPPLSRHAIDTQGVALLTSWINNLTSCN
jgi:uncharacterized repeat protein (TIGR03806 family)